jgi:4-hydroxybenzoate polyprenyltransferase
LSRASVGRYDLPLARWPLPDTHPISISAQNSERVSSPDPAGRAAPSDAQVDVASPDLSGLRASSALYAGLKIVVEAVAFRLKKLEMANLAAAGAIALALHLDFLEITARVAFAFVLNVLVYLNNDYIDVHIDLRSTDKDSAKTRYLAANMRAALGAQLVLTLILVAAAVAYDIGLLVPLIAGGGICVWYSAHLKQKPLLDVLAMVIWGLTMPLCGVPLASMLGWAMAIQLALFSGVFESIQVMRDADEDAQENVRTTGVVLGKKKTLLLARAIMIANTAYAALILQPIAALVTLGALLVPFDPKRIEQYWTRVKMIYGVAWLVICAWIFLKGHASGLFVAIDAATKLW